MPLAVSGKFGSFAVFGGFVTTSVKSNIPLVSPASGVGLPLHDPYFIYFQREVAKFALLTGIDATAKRFGLPQDLLTAWVQDLDFDHLPLFTELRSLVTSLSLARGVAAAASELGVAANIIDEFLRKDGKVPAFLERQSAGTQTPALLPQKRARSECGVQTFDGTREPSTEPESAPLSYTTAQKIRAVKAMHGYKTEAEAEAGLQIPLQTLLRWRHKVKRYLFQDLHVERLYGDKRRVEKDRFFFEMDEALYKWWQVRQKNGREAADAIAEKARIIAKVDTDTPVISPAWVTCFRAHYKI